MKRHLILVATITATGLLSAGVYWKSGHAGKNSPVSADSLRPHVDSTAAAPSVSSTIAPSDVSEQKNIEAIQAIFRAVPSATDRLAVARRIVALSRDLSESEQSDLVRWVLGAKPEGYSDSLWLFVLNEVMNKLGEQRHPSAQWGDKLLAITRDQSRDAGQRDYAVQHLGEWIEPQSGQAPCEKDAIKREAIVSAMLDAAQDANGDVAGTALMDLNNLLEVRDRAEQQRQPLAQYALDLKAEQLRPIALKQALAADVSNTARTTALQVCARRGFAEALPAARCVAVDAKQPFMLRLAAIAALGSLGETTDESLLKNIVAEGDQGLIKAAEPALKRLEGRVDTRSLSKTQI
jgi:hypothetical protein